MPLAVTYVLCNVMYYNGANFLIINFAWICLHRALSQFYLFFLSASLRTDKSSATWWIENLKLSVCCRNWGLWPYLWALLTPQATWAIGLDGELSHPVINCCHFLVQNCSEISSRYKSYEKFNYAKILFLLIAVSIILRICHVFWST